jgi:hypothetical protein
MLLVFPANEGGQAVFHSSMESFDNPNRIVSRMQSNFKLQIKIILTIITIMQICLPDQSFRRAFLPFIFFCTL